MTLDPLRAALRAQAEADAKRQVAAAVAARSRCVAEAQATARGLIEQGRLDGERLAGEESRRRLAVAYRQARELVLGAQRALAEELRRRARAGALALRDEPGYDTLVERLGSLARSQLGEAAELTIDPPGRGGVVARAGAASVDYTLPAVADRALDGLDARLETLWR
jgi:hypothetical protein